MNLLYEKNMVDPAIARESGIVEYTADADETAYEDRVGADPLRINARELFGQYRTDPVISKDDALKILSLPENRALLREGKVAILCDKPAMGMRNLGPVRDDAYYFAWQEISGAIGKKKIKGVDFTSTWEGLKLIMYDVRFAADTAKILPEEKSRLDAIADALKTVGPQARFVVSGHTADVGKPNGELSLSVERASKIADELVKRGIPKDKISSTGFGSTKPVATNDTEAGRSRNRRVEITINLAESPAD
jgi:outer membrane protein OmpA-like peptidoglycan-associated protein